MERSQLKDQEQTLNLILTFIHDFFGRKEIVADDDLFDSDVLDSIRTAELVYFLEARLKIALPAEFLTPGNFKTARSIATMLFEL